MGQRASRAVQAYIDEKMTMSAVFFFFFFLAVVELGQQTGSEFLRDASAAFSLPCVVTPKLKRRADMLNCGKIEPFTSTQEANLFTSSAIADY